MGINYKQNKGIISELIALAYLAKQPDTIVFQAIGGIGPIDIVTFNIKTKEYTNYDVKSVSYRKNKSCFNKKGDKINRSPSKKQKDLKVKLLYVHEDGAFNEISANFDLSELTKSQIAERKGLPNNPSPGHIDNLKKLC